MTLEPSSDRAIRKRARWKKAQQARRDRMAVDGLILFRAWVSAEESALLKQMLTTRRVAARAVRAQRQQRLKQLLRKAKRGDASSGF